MSKLSSPISWSFSYKQNKISSDFSPIYVPYTQKQLQIHSLLEVSSGEMTANIVIVLPHHVRILWNILQRHLIKCFHLFYLLYNHIVELILHALPQHSIHVLLLLFYFCCIFVNLSTCLCGFGLILVCSVKKKKSINLIL